MATLADQVREMLRILEVVDPQAAARIKGLTASAPPPVAVAPVRAIIPEPFEGPPPQQPAKTSPTVPVVSDHPDSLILPELTQEKLVTGVIWSEILSKPVSRRRSRQI